MIGIETYRQKLPTVNFAVSDARLVSDCLTKLMWYSGENIVTLLNENASIVDMAKYLEQWLSNNVESGLLYSFSIPDMAHPIPKRAMLI